jgi:hypothetical protein
MRKADDVVKEVVCAETGKPISKIPAWLAGVNVRFMSDEARQKSPNATALADIEPLRRLAAESELDEVKSLGIVVVDDEADEEIEDLEIVEDEVEEDV